MNVYCGGTDYSTAVEEMNLDIVRLKGESKDKVTVELFHENLVDVCGQLGQRLRI